MSEMKNYEEVIAKEDKEIRNGVIKVAALTMEEEYGYPDGLRLDLYIECADMDYLFSVFLEGLANNQGITDIVSVMNVIGVKSLSEMKGKIVRVVRTKGFSGISCIGNAIKDHWFICQERN